MEIFNRNLFSTWYVIRFSAIALVPGCLIDSEIIVLVQGFLLLHAKHGLETIIFDYTHNYSTQLLFLFFARLLALKILFYSIEFIL